MKYFAAIVFLISTLCSPAAPAGLPPQRKLVQSGEVLNEQKNRYEGSRVISVEFRGNRNFSSETLRGFMKTQVAELYNAEKLEADKDRLRDFLSRSGYLKAHFDEPEIESSMIGLKIVMPLQEGIPYRAGAITVKGSTVFALEEVIKAAGLNSGEIVDGKGIGLGLKKLKTLYGNRGYFHFEADVSVEYIQTPLPAEEGVVDVTLNLEEGEVFRINTIRFEGNTRTADEVLRSELRIREGEIYNEDLLETSLKRLNALGLYEELRPEDAGFRTDTKSKQLEVYYSPQRKGKLTG
jgi:outer membrane protein insertion porin family